MIPRPALTKALLCLLFALQLAAAFRIDLHRRQDDQSSSLITTGTESKPTQTRQPGSDQTNSGGTSVAETNAPKTTAFKTGDDATTDTATATTSSELSVSTNGTLSDDVFQNVTIPAGELPLAPVLTPGWGVAGAFMLIAGGAYTLVGIRNRTVHAFLSVAFSTALGIAVLIIYVMNPPISNALQGGYVAAAILSGCALGVGSIFFKDLTEGLGCALGGFCVSMWLLTLVPGGLLTTVASKAAFIASFTVAGGAFYVSHYTRDWALISMISFAGGTIAVLGIDCFSRAGLKEFWAYVWGLNKNLFPLGADTYPVTKGIRVQSAAIVIICFVGVISQIKLWRVVREKRVQRAAERAKEQRDLEAEEANVGRQIEETTARDRRAWEREYGNAETGDSSLSDNASEKRLRESDNYSIKPASEPQVYEMADMTDSDRSRHQAEPLEKDMDGKVTVRVAADDAPDDSPFTDDGNDDPKIRSTSSSTSQSLSISAEKRRQSQEPTSTEVPQRDSRHLPDECSEELVIASKVDREDDESSLAVTLDRQSLDSDRRSALGGVELKAIEINARLSQDDTQRLQSESNQDAKKHLSANTVSETLTSAQNDIKTANSHLEDPNSTSQNGQTEKPKSATSGVSARASLTKDHLPRTLSRVALSYRTNEWAKHLAYADTPDPEDITIAEVPKATKRDSQQERVAPVNIEELQQGVADGVPPPAIIRSDSRNSVASLNHAMAKRDSKQSLKMSAGSPSPDKDTQQLSPAMNPSPMPRSSSAMAMRRNSPHFEPIVEEHDSKLGNEYMGDTLRSKGSIPGVKSFNSPQTLIGQRELFLRNKSQGNLLANNIHEQYASVQPTPSDAGSLHNYPMYAAALATDPDDIPLSQRKQLMHRQNSLSALSGSPAIPHMASSPDLPQSSSFNSHQPQRSSNLPTPAVREAQLANFRSSVQHDLRSGGALVSASGRETPFASTNNLLSGREAEVQRSIEMQRNMLLNQKDQEAQRKEMTRLEKEWADRVFDERMRSGELMDAHRSVMRKMQNNAKE
ncbi:unnamed protein product [Clonostachys rosea f. rosea IK726]|uniref:Uncharacterized protein n=1 Tax=Clonostachys rosea f. rosea IK726 TaxID=1349383 RepID=A0ACA9T9S8_BIOOC|nr:unnamed protein product [Clonostachys rosea f. rosea IK726]